MSSISEFLNTSKADLGDLVKKYCDAPDRLEEDVRGSEASNQEKVGIISRILVVVNNYESYTVLVKQHMQSYMTHHRAEVRVRAVELLAEILRRLPSMQFPAIGIDTMLNFFLSRYATDYESAEPCLDAIHAILDHQEKNIVLQVSQDGDQEGSSVNLSAIVRSLCKPYDVTAMMQHLRFKIFEIIVLIVERPKYLDAVKSESNSRIILAEFVEAMDGEKDPRCLLLCLRAVNRMLREFPESVVSLAADAVFDVTSVYFPIMFRPPPNDPYGITTKDLVDSLDNVFCATPHLATHVVPMLLEKLRLTSTEVVQAKLDSLRTLVKCVPQYGARYISPFLESLAESMVLQMYSGDDAHVEKESLVVIQCIASELANASSASLKQLAHSEAGAGEASADSHMKEENENVESSDDTRTSAWNTFVGYLLKESEGSIKQSIDSMVGRASARMLVAIAQSSALGLGDVLQLSLPLVKRWSDKVHLGVSPQQRIVALDFLRDLVAAIDPVVDYPSECHPVKHHVPLILDLLHVELGPLEAPKEGQDEHLDKKIAVGTSPPERSGAIRCVAALVSSPPSALVTNEQVAELVTLLGHMLIDASQGTEVQQSSLEALCMIGLKRKDYGLIVLDTTVPLVMEIIDSSEAGPRLDMALNQVQNLTQIDVVFDAVVPRLLNRIHVNEQRIFTSDEALCDRVLETISTTLEQNRSNVAGIDRCCSVDAAENIGTESKLVPALFHTLREDSSGSATVRICSNRAIEIVRTLTQNCGKEHEEALLNYCVGIITSEQIKESQFNTLIPAVSSVVCSIRRGVSIPNLEEVMTIFASVAKSTTDEYDLRTIQSARHALASVLNKLDDKQAISKLVEALVGHFVPPLPGPGAQGLLSDLCDSARPTAKQAAALETFLWVGKGLAMRLSPLLPQVAATMLELLKPDSPLRDPSLRYLLAKGFGLIPGSNKVVLNAPSRARENFLFRQRFLTCSLSPLVSALEQSADPETQHSYLLAIASLLEPMPRAVVLDNMDVVLPLIIRALGASDVAARVAALYTFSVILRDSAEAVVVHLATVIPLLLDLTEFREGVRAVDRVEAIECIGELANLPYHQIHPYKALVSRRLSRALDDRKRGVRKKAVVCRNTWLTITM